MTHSETIAVRDVYFAPMAAGFDVAVNYVDGADHLTVLDGIYC